MSYFNNFPFTYYTFGDQSGPTLFQNLGVYVDIVDQAKNNTSFYNYYNIQEGDRPDHISQKLYDRTDYHWTFFMLNDKLKIQGWPLRYPDLVQKIKDDYPHTTINTRTDITTTFDVGSIITGSTSQTQGIIIKKRLDLGQIIVDRISEDYQYTGTTDVKGYIKIELPTATQKFTELSSWFITKDDVLVSTPSVLSGGDDHTFIQYNFGKANANKEYVFNTKILDYSTTPTFVAGEQITTTEDNVQRVATIDTYSLEYLATHHYEDVDGNYVDILPNAPYTQRVTIELELEGGSTEEINDSVVNSITISPYNDYTHDIDFTNIQRNIDKGYYNNTGSILKASLGAYEDIQGGYIEDGIGGTKTLDGLIGIEEGSASSYSDFVTSFPSGTDFTELYSELNTELPLAVALADTNDAGNYEIKIHMFFIVDNQLDVILEGNTFGVVYEYDIDGAPVYKENYVGGGTSSTTSPASTEQSAAWLSVAAQVETYIQQNLSTFNPASLIPITYYDRLVANNTALKTIRVLKPEVVNNIVKTHNTILNESERVDVDAGFVSLGQTGRGNFEVSGVSGPLSNTATSTSKNKSGGYY